MAVQAHILAAAPLFVTPHAHFPASGPLQSDASPPLHAVRRPSTADACHGAAACLRRASHSFLCLGYCAQHELKHGVTGPCNTWHGPGAHNTWHGPGPHNTWHGPGAHNTWHGSGAHNDSSMTVERLVVERNACPPLTTTTTTTITNIMVVGVASPNRGSAVARPLPYSIHPRLCLPNSCMASDGPCCSALYAACPQAHTILVSCSLPALPIKSLLPQSCLQRVMHDDSGTSHTYSTHSRVRDPSITSLFFKPPPFPAEPTPHLHARKA